MPSACCAVRSRVGASARPALHPRRRTSSYHRRNGHAKAAQDDVIDSVKEPTRLAEDPAKFDLEQQTVGQWTRFFAVLAVVSAILVSLILFTNVLDNYVSGFEEVLIEPQYAIVGMLSTFALVHSGLAYLRPYGEGVIGARGWRVLFAGVSLPLATVAVFYFINHRYDGAALWNIRGVAGVRPTLWFANFVSFLFLYPSTFNLLEVAAVDEPKLHLWESGVMRITRHPQAWGQLLWCLAHTAWIGSSFMLWTSAALCAHHFLGMFHGDFRLRRKYGDAYHEVEARTSIVPFAAILDGRQTLPRDYWREWLQVPYFAVVIFTIGTYFAHPLLQRAASSLDCVFHISYKQATPDKDASAKTELN